MKEIYTRTKYKNSPLVRKRFALQNPFEKEFICAVEGCKESARGFRNCEPLCFKHFNNFVKREVKNNGK